MRQGETRAHSHARAVKALLCIQVFVPIPFQTFHASLCPRWWWGASTKDVGLTNEDCRRQRERFGEVDDQLAWFNMDFVVVADWQHKKQRTIAAKTGN